MNPWINYHHLYYFKTIATEGSISKAAEALNLGQPTLSAQLKQFEETIGVPLFERQHKKLILTEQGRRALEYANEIFKLGSEMLEVLHDRAVHQKIHVQIGALDSVPKHLTLEILNTAKTFGDATFTVLEGNGEDLIKELSLHRIDLFVSDFNPSNLEIPGLYSKRIAKVPVGVYASPQYKDLRKEFPKSLSGAPLIVPTRTHSRLRHDIEQYFKNREWDFNVVVETQDTNLQKLMGANDWGVIVVPTFAVEDLVARKELVHLGYLDGVYEEFFLVAASRKIENPISSRIMKEKYQEVIY